MNQRPRISDGLLMLIMIAAPIMMALYVTIGVAIAFGWIKW